MCGQLEMGQTFAVTDGDRLVGMNLVEKYRDGNAFVPMQLSILELSAKFIELPLSCNGKILFKSSCIYIILIWISAKI